MDFATLERAATEEADVYRAIAATRALTGAQVAEYGTGPMDPEPE